MPERPLTIATYAAGASLAAVTLVYVFGPTFFLDDDAANSSRSSRKKGVVGLVNPANDCFINSVLQALAGLPELRVYLIREMHRRKLDGPELYKDITAAIEEQEKRKPGRPLPEWKLLSFQQGHITAGLKDVLDALNERPIYKKTISAQSFIRVVEESFRTRINRTQQDAQEFLQLVAERLSDEHAAADRVRRWARQGGEPPESVESAAEPKVRPAKDGVSSNPQEMARVEAPRDSKLISQEDSTMSPDSSPVDHHVDSGSPDSPPFPLEGKLESQVECSHCHFKPKASVSSFVSLTLNVPYGLNSTTLNACLDGLLKIEHIDDFVCDKCRLVHALDVNARQLAKSGLPQDDCIRLEQERTKLEAALRDDPEKPPEGVKLPDSAAAPRRRISRHTRVSKFPSVLAVHLNRSMWNVLTSSSKNQAKVAFPEILPLGGLLDRKTYRLLSVVTHKGGHNSGHYETFRRQYLSAPFSTPASMGTEGIYSLRPSPAPSPRVSAAPSPRLTARFSKDLASNSQSASSSGTPPRLSPSTTMDSPSSSSVSSRSLQASASDQRRPPTSAPLEAIPTPGLPPPPAQKQSEEAPKRPISLARAVNMPSRKRKGHDRWWRISDDKIKECKTTDVMGQQREVYLLFYEMVNDEMP